MSRLSREKKREQKHADRTAGVVAPLDVHVRTGGTATMGGVPVVAADGEEIQRAVLSHLHRIALATGHPVCATVHDERIGYVVALRVDPDGSSHFTGEPSRLPAAAQAPAGETAPAAAPAPQGPADPPTGGPAPSAAVAPAPPAGVPAPAAGPSAPDAPAPPPAPAPADGSRAPAPADGPAPAFPDAPAVTDTSAFTDASAFTDVSGFADGPVFVDAPAFVDDEPPARADRDEATHLLRQVPDPAVRDSALTFRMRALSEPEAEQAPRPAPTHGGGTPPPGTVTAPTGVFGPPPSMDEQPAPDTTSTSTPTPPRATAPAPSPIPAPIPLPLPVPAPAPVSGAGAGPALKPLLPEGLVPDVAFEPDPGTKPTPARGFDAIAEAVLGDDPRTLHGDGSAPALLAEPNARINEAVRSGRTDAAAALAERTVVEASATLGPEHPEVLRLRELTAYIAYLAGDPLRAFHVSLDLTRIHRRAGDAEAAYGNVQSAAAAWRAVRDPFQGLNLGTELLALWTELTTEEGPAADDVEELESARARMLRLAARARKAGG
ncbi:tetratricopeptide repeat protein [Streptomyces asoensis]|uniref:tetratricopeptide repeat protein n=1 Tax=Streptomyces asoensis TaxID=249586 RepID=UPI0033F2F8C5